MRTIDADWVLGHLKPYESSDEEWRVTGGTALRLIYNAVNNAPTVDAVPVVHTRWAHLGGDEWCCPVCGFVITTEGSWDKPTKKYCEDCGAKMDGGNADDR